MNLVVGATGMVGTEICRLIAASGKPVKALVRASSAPAKVENLERLGAIVVEGDLRDPVSLNSACDGVRAVISTASAMPFAYVPGENTPESTDQDGCLSLIDAAREAGVEQFVYTSFPPTAVSFPLQDAKRAVESFMEPARTPSVGFHTWTWPNSPPPAWTVRRPET
jgi:uncharacterized protein YbjT (DUF2867 family)